MSENESLPVPETHNNFKSDEDHRNIMYVNMLWILGLIMTVIMSIVLSITNVAWSMWALFFFGGATVFIWVHMIYLHFSGGFTWKFICCPCLVKMDKKELQSLVQMDLSENVLKE
ncbi:Hypothetical_protein [Hexamita inflata]|uniref:Hypothetical_protein n=1 Tax=Hexamita inflata TaxID=28002 RepID=A0AA86NWD3_9EUKA|nr:Hypothetical protein HINF_LOCUS13614 [Hexamita inflata]CAI9925999.1 Hypothetical protein HINF_LOCUS13644 [Hexamita inflata]CAI9933920.1 Hypothetical protein HINF_LOCUS21565 [Hexamita inflata]